MRFILMLIVALLPCFAFAAEPTTQPTTNPASAELNKVVPDVRFHNIALADVLSFFSDITGMTVTADWNALRKVQIEMMTPVSLEMKNKTFGEILDALLLQLGPEKNLTYTAEDKTIEITTKAAKEKK